MVGYGMVGYAPARRGLWKKSDLYVRTYVRYGMTQFMEKEQVVRTDGRMDVRRGLARLMEKEQVVPTYVRTPRHGAACGKRASCTCGTLRYAMVWFSLWKKEQVVRTYARTYGMVS